MLDPDSDPDFDFDCDETVALRAERRRRDRGEGRGGEGVVGWLVACLDEGVGEVFGGPLVIAEDVVDGAVGFDDDSAEVMADGSGFAEEEEAKLSAELFDGGAVTGGERPVVGIFTVA